jgi:hypothetical protein
MDEMDLSMPIQCVHEQTRDGKNCENELLRKDGQTRS